LTRKTEKVTSLSPGRGNLANKRAKQQTATSSSYPNSENFWPISLTSCISKRFVCLIFRRLSYNLKSGNLLCAKPDHLDKSTLCKFFYVLIYLLRIPKEKTSWLYYSLFRYFAPYSLSQTPCSRSSSA